MKQYRFPPPETQPTKWALLIAITLILIINIIEIICIHPIEYQHVMNMLGGSGFSGDALAAQSYFTSPFINYMWR